MGFADDLLEKIYQWIRQRVECAEKLEELARELESIRERCNAAECVGNSVSVVGAACLVGAGVATLLTGGAAAPFLGIAGAAYTGVGVAVTIGTKITEHFVSSGPMKEAEQIERRTNKTAAEIQRLSQRLKDEIRRDNPWANLDKLDQLFMVRIVKAVTIRYRINYNFDCRNFGDFDNSMDLGMRRGTLTKLENGLIVAVAGVLAVFSFKLSGKKYRFLLAEGTKQLLKEMSSTGFKTAFKGGAMVVGGAVGMAFALHEAIDSWTEMIKKNHVTEASQSLRDTAKDIRKMSRTLRDQLDNIKKMLEERARRQREEEKRNKLWNVFQTYPRKEITASSRDAPGRMNTRNALILIIVVVMVYLGSGWRRTESGECDTEQSVVTRAGPLRIGLLKVQSLSYRMSRVPELVSKHHLDVFLTTGTRIQQETAYQVLHEASPQNFNFYFQAESRGLDAVTVQFSEPLLDDLLVFDFVTTFQCVVTELRRPGWKQPLLFITMHRASATATWTIFLAELQELLDQVSECYDSVLLSGDFLPQSGDFLPQSGNVQQQSGDIQQQSGDVQQQSGDVQQQSSSNEFKDLLRTNRLVQHGEGVLFSRNVEISSLTVNIDADSHQYATFNAKPKPSHSPALLSGPLNIGLLKVQSLSYRLSRVPELISKHHLDVFLTTGTRIQQETAYQVLHEASPQNFNFYFQAESRGLDAVTVQFSEPLLDDLLVFDFVTTFQCVVTELRRPGWKQPLLFITMHRASATTAWTIFLAELQELLDQVSECYDSVLLSGDFLPQSGDFLPQSGDVQQQSGDVQQQSSSDEFKDLLRTNRLVQHGEGVLFSRNVEISSLTVNIDADSHQYATFNAKPKPSHSPALLSGPLNIGLLKVQSLSYRLSRVPELISKHHLDVFLTTGTRIQQETAYKVLHEASPQNFNFYFQAESRELDAVTVQFSEPLLDDLLVFDFVTTFQCVVTELRRPGWKQPLLFITMHRASATTAWTIFLAELQELLDQVSECYDSVLLSGDFLPQSGHVQQQSGDVQQQSGDVQQQSGDVQQQSGDVQQQSSSDEFKDLLRTNRLVQHGEGVLFSRNVEISSLTVNIDADSHQYATFNAKPKPSHSPALLSGPLNIGLLKAQSLSYRLSRVPELISKHHLDVFLTTGTRIQQETAYQVLQEASPQNFNFYFQAESRGLGAITVQFSETLLDDLLVFDFVTTFQCVVTELRRSGWKQPLLFITMQRAAAAVTWTVFLAELQELLDQVCECYDSVLLSGDFLPQSGDVQPQSSNVQFEDLLRTNRLVQHREGMVFSRNVELSSLKVNADADSHQYVTFNAEPKHKDTEGGQELPGLCKLQLPLLPSLQNEAHQS